MGHLPFAFSVHHFINSVGSDAGFASIIGLAVLVLLYFSHARETAALREEAEAAARRVQELEARLAGLGRQPAPARPPSGTPVASRGPGSASPASGAPPPASAAGLAAAQAANPAGVLGAPAGVAAPPLTAATRLIPPGSPSQAPGAQTSESAIPAAAPPVPAAPTGGNGTGEYAVPAHNPAPVRQPVAPRAAASPTSARTAALPPRAPAARREDAGPGWLRRFLPLVIGALVVVAVVAVLVIATSSTTKTQSTASTPASNAPAAHPRGARPVAFNNSSVTVAVLNGTPTVGLAARTSGRLSAAGFKAGKVASASDQTRSATVAAYFPGHRQDALAVAKTLKLGSASVQPVDTATQAIACPPPAACTATVVVTVGSDLSGQ